MSYFVRLLDSNDSIVREYETENVNVAIMKGKHWRKLFPANKVVIEEAYPLPSGRIFF